MMDQNEKLQIRFRAWVVTRKFQKVQDINQEETFAPVNEFLTLRRMLEFDAWEGLELH